MRRRLIGIVVNRLSAAAREKPAGALRTVHQVAELIRRGALLMMAGEEALLSRLPQGRWIGATIPDFMTTDGGCLNVDRVFVTELPDSVTDVEVRA